MKNGTNKVNDVEAVARFCSDPFEQIRLRWFVLNGDDDTRVSGSTIHDLLWETFNRLPTSQEMRAIAGLNIGATVDVDGVDVTRVL